MNNLFLEGPIQTGKSTLIREVLQTRFGRELSGVGGFTVQRMSFPTPGDDKRFGFRLMPASAPIAAHTCVTTTDENLMASDGVFKLVSPSGSHVDLNVFETKGVELMEQALADYEAGRIRLILLDEIGGHEMVCDRFRETLYRLLDSDAPCVGVIKLRESAEKMVRKASGKESGSSDLLKYNDELHRRITGKAGERGTILYYERGDEPVRIAAEQFVSEL